MGVCVFRGTLVSATSHTASRQPTTDEVATTTPTPPQTPSILPRHTLLQSHFIASHRGLIRHTVNPARAYIMSHILMTRRLLVRGSSAITTSSNNANHSCRQAVHSAGYSSLVSSFDSLSMNTTTGLPPSSLSASTSTTTRGGSPSSCHQFFFSSLSTKPSTRATTVVELPPNLKFDPRAKSSPFYGLERVGEDEKRQKSQTAAASASAVNEANDDDDVDGNEQIKANTMDDSDELIDDYDDDYEESDQILYDLSTKPPLPRATPLPARLHIPIHDLSTASTLGSIHLSAHTFGCDPIRVDILHRCVVYQRNKRRGKRNAGARTKTIHEVSGSGRKVRNQKGGGVARAGHSRPAHWRGGAKAHGPKGSVQDYTTKLNKKVRKMGVRHALSQKLLEGNLIVMGDLNAKSHKTKELEEALGRFGIAGKKGSTALIVDDAREGEDATKDYDDTGDDGSSSDDAAGAAVYGGLNVNLKVASGNLFKVKVMNQLGTNVYDLLKHEKLVLSLSAVKALEERLERDL